MKSFDSPGDVKRAFQFLRKKTWDGAAPMDKAVFLSFLQGVPSAYSEVITVATPLQYFWDWIKHPADLGNSAIVLPGAFGRERFWDGGIKLPKPGFINGWFFVPDYIKIRSFLTGGAADKAMNIDTLDTAIRGASDLSLTGNDARRAARTIGFTDDGVLKPIQIFVRNDATFVGTRIRTAPLLDTVLLPYNGVAGSPNEADGKIQATGITGAIVGDIHKWTMEGRWYFHPTLIEEETVADD